MITTRQKWIEAGRLIAENAEAKVSCPQCAHNYLEVFDVRNAGDSSELERYMCCPNCGANNVLRMRR